MSISADYHDALIEKDRLFDEVERLRAENLALRNGCPIHGPCPICRAEKWLGDPRKCVEL